MTAITRNTEVLMTTTNGGVAFGHLVHDYSPTYSATIYTGRQGTFTVSAQRVRWVAPNIDVRSIVHPFVR